MIIYILLACFASLGVCQQSDVKILNEHLSNGDENEIVSIDLKKQGGSDDISLRAQIHIHLNQSQVYVNGHPINHNIVNSVRMRISIMEIKTGKPIVERLAPATFRVLVTEKNMENGYKKLVAEVEFVEVERYQVFQVDVKQVIWEGSNRLPVTSISFKDSIIHHAPHEQDHRIFVPDAGFGPRLPEHGLKGDIDGYHPFIHYNQNDGSNHSKILCWFNRLSVGGKIAILSTAFLTFLGSLLTLMICWKRHFNQRNLNVAVPIDDYVEVNRNVDGSLEKVTPSIPQGDGEFHMEINECFVVVDDKKPLVE